MTRPMVPCPPMVPREDALGRLQRELWIARDAGEDRLAAELQQRIDRLSARSSSVPPQRETTSAAPVRRESTSRRTARSPHVSRH